MHFRNLVLLAGTVLATAQADAQDSVAVANPVAYAVALRDSGRLEPAAVVLRALLEREPDNGDAARLLAQTLYWLKNVRGAAAVYEAAMTRHPDDTTLRLEYAQMLAETRSDARALEILRPLVDMQATRGRAMTLVGTIQYWQGDLANAAASFSAALDADPASANALRQLREISLLSSPWITLRSGGLSDDQPLDRVDAGIEAGWFMNPLLAAFVRVDPKHFRVADSASSNLIGAEAGISHYAPGAHLETRIAAGVLHRTDDDDWTARGSLGFRLPRHVSIEGRAERSQYLSTSRSVSQPVMPVSGRVAFSLNDPAGWLGEAAVRMERFFDDNTVTSAYAWALAPIVRSARVSGSVGYSFAMQDSEESRFTLAVALPPVLDPNTVYVITGRYDPYYTPESIVSHSMLGSLVVRPTAKTTLTARGAYGFKATEDAPAFGVVTVPSGAVVALQFFKRDFNPWDAHLGLDSSLSDAVTLSATLERLGTAFYRATRAGLQITYRFLPAHSR